MNALDAFTLYLAQAHGCRSIAALGVSTRSPDRPVLVDVDDRARVRRGAVWAPWPGDGELVAAPATSERALVACRVAAPGSPRASDRLAWARGALELAPAGVVAFDPLPGSRPEALNTARRMLEEQRLAPAFLGYVRDAGVSPGRATLLAVLDEDLAPATRIDAPPESFRVVAILPAYNEEDVIAQTLRDLFSQGVDVHLVDNWSTDETVERARPFMGHGLLGIERFPPDGPSRTYDLSMLLERVEEIAAGLPRASWVMLHDADERRRSPWPGTLLRDALWRVDRSGYSCVDHVTLNFWPTDDSFDPGGTDLEDHFRHFEFSDHPGHFHQRRAWKQCGERVALARSAGHDVEFPGRRVYPYKFLLKHYPLRSSAHGERKLLDRRRRWNAEERSRGWHRQYDHVEADGFVRDPSTLRRFDPATFDEDHLGERLSGAGVFARPPAWATPPRW
jgi:hypothetical protein